MSVDEKDDLKRFISNEIAASERHEDFVALRSLGKAILWLISIAGVSICGFLWTQTINLAVAIEKLDIMQSRQSHIEAIALENQKSITSFRDMERRIIEIELWRKKREEQLEAQRQGKSSGL